MKVSPVSSFFWFHEKGWTFVGGLLWKMASPFDSLYKERPLCSSFPLNQGGNHPLPFSFDAKITLAISLQKILHPKGHAAAYAGSCRFGHNIFFSDLRSYRFELVLYHSFTLLRYILLLIKICCLRAMWVPVILVNRLLSKNKRNLWWVNML